MTMLETGLDDSSIYMPYLSPVQESTVESKGYFPLGVETIRDYFQQFVENGVYRPTGLLMVKEINHPQGRFMFSDENGWRVLDSKEILARDASILLFKQVFEKELLLLIDAFPAFDNCLSSANPAVVYLDLGVDFPSMAKLMSGKNVPDWVIGLDCWPENGEELKSYYNLTPWARWIEKWVNTACSNIFTTRRKDSVLSPWADGVAYPGASLGRATILDFIINAEVRPGFRHEIIHLLMGRLADKRLIERLPLWLWEGLAELVASLPEVYILQKGEGCSPEKRRRLLTEASAEIICRYLDPRIIRRTLKSLNDDGTEKLADDLISPCPHPQERKHPFFDYDNRSTPDNGVYRLVARELAYVLCDVSASLANDVFIGGTNTILEKLSSMTKKEEVYKFLGEYGFNKEMIKEIINLYR